MAEGRDWADGLGCWFRRWTRAGEASPLQTSVDSNGVDGSKDRGRARRAGEAYRLKRLVSRQ